MDDIDVVAFTRGPGMSGCLNVCGNMARALSAAHGKPLLGINHMVRLTLCSSEVRFVRMGYRTDAHAASAYLDAALDRA